MQLFDYDKALAELKKQKLNIEFLTEFKSGKEAKVWLVRGLDGSTDNRLMALKLYKDHNMRAFNNFEKYFQGTYIKSRTLRKAVEKKTDFGMQFIQDSWVGREYALLKTLSAADLFVPKPFAAGSNWVLMEYIGDANAPAPLLSSVKLSEEAARYCFDVIFEHIEVFFELDFVHGDLSAFNILWWNDQPWIIDFPQAVNVKTNKKAKEILYKDLNSLYKYFDRFCQLDKANYEARLAELTKYMFV